MKYLGTWQDDLRPLKIKNFQKAVLSDGKPQENKGDEEAKEILWMTKKEKNQTK